MQIDPVFIIKDSFYRAKAQKYYTEETSIFIY